MHEPRSPSTVESLEDDRADAPSPADTLFDAKRAEFKEYYATEYSRLLAAEKAFRNLIVQLLDRDEFELPKVISRLKDRDECLKKFALKYRNEAEKGGAYEIKGYITDLIGVRVVCLYESDIPKIEAIIRQEFDIISVTDKTKTLLDEIKTFGYKGLHFDVRISQNRWAFPEYLRFKDLRSEIQVRSIVQDAWSEVEHKLRYKKQSPPEVQRRIVRLAALFELADQEFAALNQVTERLINAATKGEAPTEETQSQRRVLNAFNFLSLVTKFHPKYRFEAEAVDGFVDEIKSMDRKFTVDELKNACDTYRDRVWQYKQFHRNRVNINPFTEIRLVLYAYDRARFADMLFPNQRQMFEDWLARPNPDSGQL